MVQATRRHLTLKVPAIRDAHCTRTIQESLADVNGVSNVHAPVEMVVVDVEIDPAKFTARTVEALLAEAGYLPKTRNLASASVRE